MGETAQTSANGLTKSSKVNGVMHGADTRGDSNGCSQCLNQNFHALPEKAQANGILHKSPEPTHRQSEPAAGATHEDDPGYQAKDLVAIVGMGCRMPANVSSPSQLWQMLSEGESGQCKIPESRFNVDGFYNPDLERQRDLHTDGGYFLEGDQRQFDNTFFGINNLEATHMDPQQRKLLEVVYECFENTGLTLEQASGANIGCYVGNFTIDFQFMQGKDIEHAHRYTTTGMGTAILANRISHAFNLQGPSVVVDTACSSSLYGLHAACTALKARECDGAVVAGANLIQSPDQQLETDKAGVLSPTSTCHTFDASADGYGRGEAIGALFLKRLDDAIKDRDPIRAVIRGSAVNSNGHTPGLTQPSMEGQEAVIRKAYRQAYLPTNETDYVECHGTGTAIGDPIEVEALSRVLQHRTGHKTLIGSVKTNLGHSEAASGISSIMKVTLALENGVIPPTIGVQTPNPRIAFSDWNCEVVRKLQRWPDVSAIPRASINSFGYGGANAHIILEAASRHVDRPVLTETRERDTGYVLLPFSAHKEKILRTILGRAASWAITNTNLADLEYTLSERRSKLAFRSYIITKKAQDTSQPVLEHGSIEDSRSRTRQAKIGFVFTGQGAQWPGMGSELLPAYPAFQRTILSLENFIASAIDPPSWKLTAILTDVNLSEFIHKASISQTVCTAVQLGLVDLLRELRITPSVVVGHSSGEIAASYAAGHISAKQAILTAYYRGLAVSHVEQEGSMISVGLTESRAREQIDILGLNGKVNIACVNSLDSCTLSGDADGVEAISKQLHHDAVFVRKLKTNGKAYHSHHMKGDVARNYAELLRTVYETQTADGNFCRTGVEMHSSLWSCKVTEKDTASLEYWVNNLISPVRFAGAVADLMSNNVLNVIEIGPHPALALPFKQTCEPLGSNSSYNYMHTLERNKNSIRSILQLTGKCFQNSVEVDLAAANRREAVRGHKSLTTRPPNMLKDLAPYPWEYDDVLWSESRASYEFRHRKNRRHELLGSLVPGTSANSYTWRNLLKINDVTWLTDHKLNQTIVFPAASFLAMAIEGLCQTTAYSNKTKRAITFRSVKLLKALVFTDENHEIEIFTELRPKQLSTATRSKHWWEFLISTFVNGSPQRHATGMMYIQEMMLGEGDHNHCCTITNPKRAQEWYQRLAEEGLSFGPNFQTIGELGGGADTSNLQVVSKANIPSMNAPNLPYREYELHPVTIDALFQTAIIATARGQLRNLYGQVPVSIDRMTLNLDGQCEDTGRYTIKCESEVAGFGSNICQGSLFGPKANTVCSVENLRFFAYSGASKYEPTKDRNPMLRISWKPDLNITGNEQLAQALAVTNCDASIPAGCLVKEFFAAIELIAHKNAFLKILEIGQRDDLVSRMILQTLRSGNAVKRYSSYTRTVDFSPTANIEEVQLKDDGTLGNTASSTIQREQGSYDFILITSLCQINHKLCEIQQSLDPTTHILALASMEELDHTRAPQGFELSIAQSTEQSTMAVVLAYRSVQPLPTLDIANEKLILLHQNGTHPLEKALSAQITEIYGFAPMLLSLDEMKSATLPAGATVFSTIELENSVLNDIDKENFDVLKDLADNASHVLWVSGSGLHTAKGYNSSLFLGLARSLMMERPAAKFISFDTDGSITAPANTAKQALSALTNSMHNPYPDLEFTHSNGLTYCSRFVHESAMNCEFRSKQSGQRFPMALNRAGNCKLTMTNIGQLDTLHFEQQSNKGALPSSYVEVQVKCLGLNAKDFYGLSGVVDTRQGTCNLEFGGVVVAAAEDVTSVAVGDRVVVMAPNHFETTARVPDWACHKLYDCEDLATLCTIPVVFSTAIYALNDRARLQSGESVLIHSATGGLGMAAIQIARNIHAEIYATAGTEEKRRFLVEEEGLAPDHVFSSRDSEFLTKIFEVSGGRGVDVVLNSLTGDLLQESWRCCAEFGRFVEVGKKDILEAGLLDMEMFKRSVTFTAFDLSDLYFSTLVSHRRVWASLLDRCLEFYRRGIIQPIRPSRAFDCEQIIQAFRYFGSRERLGKVVVSMENSKSTIDVRPLKYQTTLDGSKSYLMVGCLGGLGRSLATWMAHRGARWFTFLSRSGMGPETSQSYQLVKRLKGLGCKVNIVTGDVAILENVESAIKQLPSPLGGIVHAAMGLQESLFTAMPWEGWVKSVRPKVKGTYNLHASIKKHEKTLDFFVLTSSISGSVGTATESNYCAANSFLDAFARWRRKQGLAATSLGLGMISEVGYLHEHPDIEALLLRKGIHPINEEELLQIFDIALTEQRGGFHDERDPQYSRGHILTGLEPAGLGNQRLQGFEGHSHVLDDPRAMNITHLLSGFGANAENPTTAPAGSKGPAELAEVLHLGYEAVSNTVATVITKKLSNLLLQPLESLQPLDPLGNFGMDSMLAAEFRTYIFHACGVEVPFFMLLEKCTTIESLSHFVSEKVVDSSS